MLSLAAFIMILLGIFFYTDLHDSPSHHLNSLYIATSRIFWGIAIALNIYAFHFGSLKRVSDFLSRPFWTPFGKLSFSLYLTHTVVQYAGISLQKHPINFTRVHLVIVAVAKHSILLTFFE